MHWSKGKPAVCAQPGTTSRHGASTEPPTIPPRRRIGELSARTRLGCMTIYRGCCVCRPNGTILAMYDWEGVKQPTDVLGSITWHWFAPHDQDRVMNMFARAVIGSPLPPAIVDFHPERAAGDMVCHAHYIPTGEPAAPVLGAFSMFTRAVMQLSDREREIAKLIPGHTTKEISRLLGITPGAVDSQRARIARRLGKDGPSLAAFCALLRTVL
jgi:DNA-binding CsgD family transcriptional regulator